MTDARAEMRKNVREIIARGCGCDRPCGDRMSVLDCGCLNDADAAIDLVLEEAASVAALFPAVTHGDLATDPHAAAAQAAQEIAAAILAMKGKP